MKNPFLPGDIKTFIHVVTEADIAAFDSGQVHPVYSTFALARDAEWSGRLFVLEMKDEDEEGIGTGLHIEHVSPALVGSEVKFMATLERVEKNKVVTTFSASVGGRQIANGRQWQKIVARDKLEHLFKAFKNA